MSKGTLRNQAANRINRAVGALFETWIQAACDYYWAQGYACIEKTPEPLRPLQPYGDRSRGQFIACFVKQAQPDFKGTLCDGTCILFDAKHTEKDRIQQLEELENYKVPERNCTILFLEGVELR